MKLILSMFVAAVLLSDVEAGRSLVFPKETANSFVELTPAKPLSLDAFSLCLRFATELKGKRDVILFAYRKPYIDELNVWLETDGRLSLYLSGLAAFFEVPELGPLANHVCLTWESLTGRTTMYVNGRSSATQIFQRDHRVRPKGKIILGQDPDNFLGGFQAEQSFVGEIFGVNMWDYVLPSVAIQLLSTGEDFSDANVLDWATVTLMPTGCAVEYK
ncbi:C-reactive protein-like isoform X1 [Gadus chalcogrammus]|uniref:C-reactive protein-like isoform X1 n=1 Tax=Gadus chalcogrammus TaxID=1042646 RepID=UPI0024C40EEF|nr:C-reactive protein-like isoform X1 [Gadus chalcogrammus]